MDTRVNITVGDCREVLAAMPEKSVQCCVTSPPYFGLRDYGNADQIGLEQTPDAFVAELVKVFQGVKRVLKDDGTLWLNLGDSYASNQSDGDRVSKYSDKQSTNAGKLGGKQKVPKGLKPKDLIGIPWRVALALQADGWYLRQDIIWSKPNPMPESVTDRCTKAHEYIFLLSKKPKYFYDAEAIKESASTNGRRPTLDERYAKGEPKRHGLAGAAACGAGGFGVDDDGTRNKRSVWEVTTKPYSGAHFATFPPDLIKPCILAGTKAGDTVLDPFGGSGTTGMVALELGRSAELIELNPEYAKIAEGRTHVTPGLGI